MCAQRVGGKDNEDNSWEHLLQMHIFIIALIDVFFFAPHISCVEHMSFEIMLEAFSEFGKQINLILFDKFSEKNIDFCFENFLFPLVSCKKHVFFNCFCLADLSKLLSLLDSDLCSLFM